MAINEAWLQGHTASYHWYLIMSQNNALTFRTLTPPIDPLFPMTIADFHIDTHNGSTDRYYIEWDEENC